MSWEPLRIGVLGAAGITSLALIEPARLMGAELSVIAARDLRRAEAFAAANGIGRAVRTYEEVVGDPRVDAIYNPLPNAFHAPWNRRAIEYGKHVLSEKPFACNADEAQEVYLLGRAAPRVVADGFHYVYHPVTAHLAGLLDSGVLGPLERVEVAVDTPPPPPHNIRWDLELGGGGLMDLGCYALHFHRWLGRWAGGEPLIVDASGGMRAGLRGVDEWGEIGLRFPSGLTGQARYNMAAPELRCTYRIVGESGWVRAENFVRPNDDDRVTLHTKEGSSVRHFGRLSSYAYQLQAFTRAVRLGEPMSTADDDPVKTMRLVDAGYVALGMEPRAARGGALETRGEVG